MKECVLIVFIFLLSIQVSFAKNVKVMALSDLSTDNPPDTWRVQLVDGFESKDGIPFYAGSIITGTIKDVKKPKRLKRNAQFTFVPVKYYDSVSKLTTDVSKDVKGNYSKISDISAGNIIKKGIVAVSSQLVSGFISPGVALVEGLVKNEDGNRAKSAVKSVYESSPVSYIEKGKELTINKNQIFFMNFKLAGEEDSTQDWSEPCKTENEGVSENYTDEELL